MKPSVLIVDDSVTVRMDLKEALEQAGFSTSLSATLAAARDVLTRPHFDLVILDVVLPDGDGIEFLRDLKSSDATTRLPVMLLSSEDEVRDRIRGLQTGADEYVGKPYDAAHVVARARELIRRRTLGRTSRPVVLTIDDSRTFREELKETLSAAGYDVVDAATGEEGLRMAADLRPDVVLVDWHLPDVVGPEVIRKIRLDAAIRRTPCLLLTGSMEKKEEMKALEAGADMFVLKEEDPGVILAKLSVLVRARPESGAQETVSLLSPKRILAVDDSVTYLQELADHLRGEGYDVVCASSGDEAMALLSVQPVDAILLDMLMPGLSGQETCRRIKANAQWRHLPLLLLTSLTEREAMIEGINAGADDYITKSDNFDTLKARLKAQLRRKQFEEENRHIREQLLKREMEAVETQAVRELAETRAAHIADLENKNEELRLAKEAADDLNRELESFSYSVSHDLRAPLRSIDGFSLMVMEDCAERLDENGRKNLTRVRSGVQHMGRLIDDMLSLARVTRKEVVKEPVDLTALARTVIQELQTRDPQRHVEFEVTENMAVEADRGLLQILLENLLGNAWKFTAKVEHARIAFTCETGENGKRTFCIRDNGAGFDMTYANKLFGTFQRLHSDQDFPGTGVGLAIVQRVVRRHGGTITAHAEVDKGAAFTFTLP